MGWLDPFRIGDCSEDFSRDESDRGRLVRGDGPTVEKWSRVSETLRL